MILDTQPQVSEFFSAALRGGTLAHGYLFKGNRYEDMYQMALSLAQILNCTGQTEPDQACGACQNCRWIADNAHPSVTTVSRMTFLIDSESGKTHGPPEFLTQDEAHAYTKKGYGKLIKTGQVERLIYQLGMHASDYRVVIFTDSEVLPASNPSGVPAPCEWRMLDINEDKSFHIRPLNSSLFNSESANRFLKTLEEPPPKTLFFFITESEAQLLDTIVSRCQTIPFQRGGAEGPALTAEQRDFLHRLMGKLGPRADFYQLQAHFEAFFTEDQGLSAPQALSLFQQYLREQLQEQGLSQPRFAQYADLQRKLEHTQSLLAAKTHAQQSMNHFFLELATSGSF